MTGRLLVVDGDRDLCEEYAKALTERGHFVRSATNASEALSLIAEHSFDVAVVDTGLAGTNAFDLCRKLRKGRAKLWLVARRARGNVEDAVGALRAGASAFVTKPPSVDALCEMLERAVQTADLRAEVRRVRGYVESSARSPMIGDTSAMKHLSASISRIAATDSSVLVTGESGTGKELVAKEIHKLSGRHGKFLAIDCAALSETLLESELFGHARGAFTGADVVRAGLFVQADHGSLFLDEIAELSPAIQAKLLRALQQRSVRPLGTSHELPFDARLIAATNRDLESDVSAGRFRKDLYYRVNVVRVHVPPLRERVGDILLLAQHFLNRCASRCGRAVRAISADAAARLMSHDWRGNVRELENCMERAATVAMHEEINVGDLPARVRGAGSGVESPTAQLQTLQATLDSHIRRALKAAASDEMRAAEILGLDRKTLTRELARLAASDIRA